MQLGHEYIPFNQVRAGRSAEAVAGGVMGKYEPLRDYLAARPGDEEPMTFGQVKRLVVPLPDSAREHRAWWGMTATDPSRSPGRRRAGMSHR